MGRQRAAALVLLVALAEQPACAADTFAAQRVDLSAADPCVRLLNATSTIGCATPRNGVIAPLHTVLDAIDVERLRSSGVSAAVTLAIAASLFSLPLRTALTRMGSDSGNGRAPKYPYRLCKQLL